MPQWKLVTGNSNIIAGIMAFAFMFGIAVATNSIIGLSSNEIADLKLPTESQIAYQAPTEADELVSFFGFLNKEDKELMEGEYKLSERITELVNKSNNPNLKQISSIEDLEDKYVVRFGHTNEKLAEMLKDGSVDGVDDQSEMFPQLEIYKSTLSDDAPSDLNALVPVPSYLQPGEGTALVDATNAPRYEAPFYNATNYANPQPWLGIIGPSPATGWHGDVPTSTPNALDIYPRLDNWADYAGRTYEVVAPSSITIDSYGICSGVNNTRSYNWNGSAYASIDSYAAGRQVWMRFKDNATGMYFRLGHVDKTTLNSKITSKFIQTTSSSGYTKHTNNGSIVLAKGEVIGNLLIPGYNSAYRVFDKYVDNACGTNSSFPHIHYGLPTTVDAYIANVYFCKESGCNAPRNIDIVSNITKGSVIVQTNSVLSSPAAGSTLNLGNTFSVTLGQNLTKTDVRLYNTAGTYFSASYGSENGAVKTFVPSANWAENGNSITLEIKSYINSTGFNTLTYNFLSKNNTSTTTKAVLTALTNLNIRNAPITGTVMSTLTSGSTRSITCKKYISTTTYQWWARIDTNPISSTTNNLWVAATSNFVSVKYNGVTISITDSRIPSCP